MDFNKAEKQDDSSAKHDEATSMHSVLFDLAYDSPFAFQNSAGTSTLGAPKLEQLKLNENYAPPLSKNNLEQSLTQSGSTSDKSQYLPHAIDGFLGGTLWSAWTTPVEGMSRSQVMARVLTGIEKIPGTGFQKASSEMLGGGFRGALVAGGLTLVNESLDSRFGDGTKNSIFKPSAFEAALEGAAASVPERRIRIAAIAGAWLLGRAYNETWNLLQKK